MRGVSDRKKWSGAKQNAKTQRCAFMRHTATGRTAQDIHTVVVRVNGLLYEGLTHSKVFLSLGIADDEEVSVRTLLLHDVAILAVDEDGMRGGDACLMEHSANVAPVHHVGLHVEVVHEERVTQVAVGEDLFEGERGVVHSEQDVDDGPVRDGLGLHLILVEKDDGEGGFACAEGVDDCAHGGAGHLSPHAGDAESD